MRYVGFSLHSLLLEVRGVKYPSRTIHERREGTHIYRNHYPIRLGKVMLLYFVSISTRYPATGQIGVETQ